MNPPQTNGHSPQKMNINANTGISIGIVVVLLSGFAVVIKGLSANESSMNTMKTELTVQAITTKTELAADIRDLKQRMSNIESRKDYITSGDFYKWLVHFQQANNDPKKLQSEGIKVPEPENTNK